MEIKNLTIDDIDLYQNEKDGTKQIKISWSANIGFGEYTLQYIDGKWTGDSECMDRGEDKSFLTSLFTEFIKMITV